MQYDVNGWPIAPERGKYIGMVYDDMVILFDTGKDFNKFYYWDKYPFQSRRVYEDELNEFNKHAYQWKFGAEYKIYTRMPKFNYKEI